MWSTTHTPPDSRISEPFPWSIQGGEKGHVDLEWAQPSDTAEDLLAYGSVLRAMQSFSGALKSF